MIYLQHLVFALWLAYLAWPATAQAQSDTNVARDEQVTTSVQIAGDDRRPIAQRGETFFTREYEFLYNGGSVVLSGDPPPSAPFGVDDRLLLSVVRPDGTTTVLDRTFNTACLENEPVPPEDVTALFQPGLNVVTVTISDVCGGFVGTLGSVMLSAITAAPAPVAVSRSPLPAAAVGGVVAIVAALLVLILRRRRRYVAATAEAAESAPIIPGPTSDPIVAGAMPDRGPSQATLVVVDGPEEWRGRSFEIGEAPLTLGTRAGCMIRLPETPGIAGEHVRLWARDGKVMLHHLARGATTSVAGNPITWASLTAGDELRVGPYVFRCTGSETAERNGAIHDVD